MPVPRTQEQIDGMAKVIFPEKVSQLIVEQIEVVPVQQKNESRSASWNTSSTSPLRMW